MNSKYALVARGDRAETNVSPQGFGALAGVRIASLGILHSLDTIEA